MFKTYTGFQYLLIDLANAFGLDKEIFEVRIQWGMDHLTCLETMGLKAETPALYHKALLAVRKAQQGLATGHLVGVDGACSGMQVMSVLTGCISGATATGMVNPDKRGDAYTEVTDAMRKLLGGLVAVKRKDAKQAVMTVLYGSKAEPKKLFGEGTDELNAFYKAVHQVAPGAWMLLQDLLESWQPYALSHEWKLPDGFDAKVKVMSKREVRIEVDELDHATFTYEFFENEGTERGLSNAANVVHSVDAYVLRCMHRRCNYDAVVFQRAYRMIDLELQRRAQGGDRAEVSYDNKINYYTAQYDRSTVADIVIVPYLDSDNIQFLDSDHLKGIELIVRGMLQHKPFALVTIHDEFKAHANNINWVRYHYKEIMAEIAESSLLNDLLSQIIKTNYSFPKLSSNLGDLIRNSNYALC